MRLRRRLVAVLVGSAGAGGGGVAVAMLLGQPWLAVLLAGLAIGAGAWLQYRWALQPVEEELAQLARRVQLHAGDAVPVPPRLRFDDFEPAVNRGLARIGEVIERLRTDGRMSREVLRLSKLGVAMFDAEGRLTELNPTLQALFDVGGDPVGKPALEALRTIELDELVQAALAGRVSERTFSNRDRDLAARVSPVPDGVLMWVEDVTDRRAAERSRSDFVANVSHELRTPVTAVMGYLEALLQDADRIPEDLVPLVQTIDRNARRLRDLFEDLLRLHRIEARSRELPLTRQRLRPVLEEALLSAADRAHIRGQDFELECPEDLAATINAEALRAIVSNLATNATAYTPEGGSVRVEAVAEGGGARIDVIDNGIGIAPRHQERIFERFYRIDDARSRDAGGTGLGLAIVKHYALASQCRVTLDSEVGRGTTFSVHLDG